METLNPEVLAEPVSMDDNGSTVSVDDGGGALTVDIATTTTGGASVFHLVSAATTNATVVKNATGQLYGYHLYNGNAAMRKVAFHNTTSTPTAGAAIYFSVALPGASAVNLAIPTGVVFSSGIAITTVTGAADTDATAVGASDLVINLFYK